MASYNRTKTSESKDSKGGSAGFKRGAARKKTEYSNAKPFTIEELLKVTEKPGFMSFDLKNEESSEKMKENNVRFLTVLCNGEDGKPRPLVMPISGRTGSKVKPGKSDNGALPSSCSFCTRILVAQNFDEKDEKKREAEVKEKLEGIACDTVETKFPGLPEDKFDSEVESQLKLVHNEYKQWVVEERINREYLRLLNDVKYRAGTLKWIKGPTQVVRGFVQYDRKFNPEQDDAEKMPENGLIPLDEPLVHHKIKVDKKTTPGKLWCKIFDVSQPIVGDKRKLATEINPKTGKMEVVNLFSVEEWIRYNSPFKGMRRFQLCFCKDGALLHDNVYEMNVRRAAKTEASAQVKTDELSDLYAYGGEFESLPAAGAAAPAGKSEPPKSGDAPLTLEEQMAKLKEQKDT